MCACVRASVCVYVCVRGECTYETNCPNVANKVSLLEMNKYVFVYQLWF